MKLVIHFNAYNGQMIGGYLLDLATKQPTGPVMNRVQVANYLAANPETSCELIKV